MFGRHFISLLGVLFSWCAIAEIDFDFRKQMLHTGEHVEGFVLTTSLEFPVSFTHSQSQLGINPGNYIDLGGKFRTGLHYTQDKHDWSSSIFVAEVFDMTPAIENRWVKNTDILRFESRYLYNFHPYGALYVHGRTETSIFPSIDLHDKEKVFEMRNVDDSFREVIKASEIRINDPFLPFFFSENIGVVSGLIQEPFMNLEIRAGVSLRQTLANDQRMFVRELENEVRIVRDLRSYFQIGPTIGSAVRGSLFSDRLEYSAGIDVLWPAWQYPSARERTFWRSFVVESSLGVGFYLSDWGFLQYQYVANHIPDIIARFQQMHSVTLNLRLDWTHKFGNRGPR